MHPAGYGNQVLAQLPHYLAAKLARRILLLEPFHSVHAARGEVIGYGKMLGARKGPRRGLRGRSLLGSTRRADS